MGVILNCKDKYHQKIFRKREKIHRNYSHRTCLAGTNKSLGYTIDTAQKFKHTESIWETLHSTALRRPVNEHRVYILAIFLTYARV